MSKLRQSGRAANERLPENLRIPWNELLQSREDRGDRGKGASSMNYAKIVKCDIANGPGVRVSLFVSGCRNHCKGCFQPETWDFSFGNPFTKETEEEIMEALHPEWIQGFSLLGGEPMEPENQEVLLPLLSRIRTELPKKDVWLYTGYRLSQIKNAPILQFVDVLVDGPFIEEQKDITLSFRGSTNQRIIRMEEAHSRSEDD